MRPFPNAVLRSAVSVALAAALFLVAARVLGGLALDRPYDVAFVPRGDALQALSPAIRLSIANYYWLETVQYLGDARGRTRGFDKLFPLVDLVTDLDPGHGYAYQTAGIVLSAEGRLDESDRILEKGMEPGRPGWWTYPFYLAFNDYFYRHDYASAARWAEVAARSPGASTNISHLAMALKVKSGDPEEAIRFLSELRSTAKDERTAQALDEQYRLAVLQRDFLRLDAAVARFEVRFGRAPVALEELVGTRELAAIPEEPFGGRYELRSDGRVHSTANDQRLHMPPMPPSSSDTGAR